jgi:hypothetical protein
LKNIKTEDEMLVMRNHYFVKINGEALLRGLKDGLSEIQESEGYREEKQGTLAESQSKTE